MPIADKGLLMQAVRDHLRRHPKAADTLQGICDWWLGSQGIVVSPQRLRGVLLLMVRLRHLRALRLPGGDVLYAGVVAKPRQGMAAMGWRSRRRRWARAARD